MTRSRFVHAALVGVVALGLTTLAGGPAAAVTVNGSTIVAASLDSVQANGTGVTLKWTDRATSELGFQVYRREAGSATLKFVGGKSTVDELGFGETYTYTDTMPAGTRQCYEIVDISEAGPIAYSNDVCTAPLSVLTAPPDGLGITSIVVTDTAPGGSGSNNPITIGTDGLGIMAYYAGGQINGPRDLAVAHCLDRECTAVTTHTIDSVGDVGRFASVRIGADGLPLISYTADLGADGRTLDDLKVAHCVDVVCTSATVTTLDAPPIVGWQTSLAIGPDGLGTIAYYADDTDPTTQSTVKVAHCLNLTCTSASTTVVDPAAGWPMADQGQLSIAASRTGYLYISYSDHYTSGSQLPGDLKMAICTSADCTSRTMATLDHTPAGQRAGDTSSITIGQDDLPLISYSYGTGTNTDLVVMHCQNLRCSGVTKTTVDRVVTNGFGYLHSSIAIGADGFGIVSYYDDTNENLKAAHCTDLLCDTFSDTTMIFLDEHGDVGSYTSTTIGTDGLPLISYRDAGDNLLKTIHCADAACALPLIAPF